ncbi:MAG: glutathione S-transferase family protein [Hyphomicrobiales bacterium]|nr:glutathione S-transferase family protein [Hyphomicrobiales bacterium]
MHTLIHHPLCAASRSVRLALAECGEAFVLREERPWAWRAEFLELNPAGSTPVLLTANGVALCGAYAISEFVAETAPSSPSNRYGLFPGSAEERAEARRLSDWFHRKFYDEVTLYLVEDKLFGALSRQGASVEPALLRAARDNLRYHLSYVGHLMEQRRWLAGPTLSFADLAAAGHLSALDYLGEVPWEEFPAAKDWYARLKSRPSFRPLLEDRAPGVPPHPSYADLDF